MQLVSRQAVPLSPPNLAHLSVRQDPVVGITWHITDTDFHAARKTWAAIQHNYMVNKGYGDTPYNGGINIEGAGEVLAGRDAHYTGAHALSHDNLANRMTWGIAVIAPASFPVDRNPIVVAGLNLVTNLFHLTYHRPPVHLFHFSWDRPDGSSTSCPDPQVAQLVRQTFHTAA